MDPTDSDPTDSDSTDSDPTDLDLEHWYKIFEDDIHYLSSFFYGTRNSLARLY